MMGNKLAVAQETAQWVADDCRQCRSRAIGGNVRWTGAAIRMDSGGMIVMDSGSSDGQH
jgi:hypothetical protein